MDLTDAQWAVLDPLFRPRQRSDGRGRPWRDTRAVVNGVLWILRTGAPWHDLPNRYPPYQTCHRRFQHWQRSGVLLQLLQKLAEDLRDRRKHHRTTEVGAWLRKVVLGYYQYHAVPGNSTQLRIFCRRIGWLWRSVLVRRSQRAQVRWDRLSPLLTRWIPQPRILHPYPDARFAATHPR